MNAVLHANVRDDSKVSGAEVCGQLLNNAAACLKALSPSVVRQEVFDVLVRLAFYVFSNVVNVSALDGKVVNDADFPA